MEAETVVSPQVWREKAANRKEPRMNPSRRVSRPMRRIVRG